jgi:hypothetical protein
MKSPTFAKTWLSLCLCSLLLSLCSCKTTKSIVAEVDVKPSDFLTHAKELKEDRKRSAYIGNWWSTDKKLLAEADKCRKIYIAPVAYNRMRPQHSWVAYVEDPDWRRDHKLPRLAKYTQSKFAEVFRNSKEPRYAVVDSPQPDALTLDLSLLEWSPSTYTGLIVRQVVDFFTFNVGGEVVLKSTRGYMALEGRLLEPKSQQPIFEFADKEVAKFVLIISIQDFFPNGQAHFAIKEWATQLEKLLRAKPGEKVSDSSPIVLINF